MLKLNQTQNGGRFKSILWLRSPIFDENDILHVRTTFPEIII